VLAPVGTPLATAWAAWEPGEHGAAVIARARQALALDSAPPPVV
jgi:hypothetical protein